jgi:hypothetical protein
MNCHAFHDLLHERLDRARPGVTPAPWADGGADADALEQHLRECPDCAALHRTARRLADALRLTAPPRPPVDLARRIARQVVALHGVVEKGADSRARSHTRARRLVAALALAACVLLALGGFRFFSARQAPAPAPDPRNDSAGAPGPKNTAPAAPSLRESVAEAGSAVARLTTRAADEALDQTRVLVPRVPAPSLDVVALDPALEPPARGLREAREGVSAGLEPVTSSARRAFGMFRRELAPAEMD